MNTRLKHFLNVFFRLAQIDLLGEIEIYVVLKLERLINFNKKQQVSYAELIMILPDLSQTEIDGVLQQLERKQFIMIVDQVIHFHPKLLQKVQQDA